MSDAEPGGAGPPADRSGIPPPPPVTDRERLVNSVVIALVDGTRLRGYVYDVSMERGDFHLYSSDAPDETEAALVKIALCKAVYFVKSLTGNPNFKENKTEFTEKRRWGRPYEVVFGDGERMVGTVETYYPEKLGFYLIPPDPGSNNLRIYVVMANAKTVRLLDEGTGEGGPGRFEAPDPATYPCDKRIELVLRVLRGANLPALSGEVLVPAPVIAFWKEKFLEGVRAGVSEEGLAELRRRGGAALERADRTPVAKRLDIVLKLCLKEDEAVLSQTTLVPGRTMQEWRDRGLEAGKDALRILGTAEASMDPGKVQERYREIVDPRKTEAKAGPSFLDSLPDILKGARKPGAR